MPEGQEKRKPRRPRTAKIVVTSATEGRRGGGDTTKPVILHLQCRLSDLQQPVNGTDVVPATSDVGLAAHATSTPCLPTSYSSKITNLAASLQSGTWSHNQSACFWDTFPFTGEPFYIPKYSLDGTYQTYGCFCSPQCAAAYLFQEHLDSAARLERYQLLNYLYSGEGSREGIQPAPSPHYLLARFSGSLTIEEYRQNCLVGESLVVTDKPLVRILPELHQDQPGTVPRKKSEGGEGFKLRRGTPRPTKAESLAGVFGMGRT